MYNSKHLSPTLRHFSTTANGDVDVGSASKSYKQYYLRTSQWHQLYNSKWYIQQLEALAYRRISLPPVAIPRMLSNMNQL